jgi:hypothetical protein
MLSSFVVILQALALCSPNEDLGWPNERLQKDSVRIAGAWCHENAQNNAAKSDI